MTSMAGGGGMARNVGVFGWNYNKANYKFDQTQRWQRYTTGRKMAMAQAGMFRQDITDLAGVSMGKLKVYGPVYGIVITVCVTVFVEGRSGLKFPGPPVFVSQIYLQCLAVGLSFMCLAAWLLFHSSMRAQVACVNLRTRKVRVPVPTQRQLDGNRKVLSTWEEQGLYDIFRVPFAMPNGAGSPEASDDESDHLKQPGYHKGGIPGVAAKIKSKVQEKQASGAATGGNAHMPGLTAGNPSWIDGELQERDQNPEHSPSGHGSAGPPEPYAHFEMLREAQKEWWACEAYMRICFLYGMMHLVMAFSYWITLHNICELAMVWCSNLGAAGLTAGVWIMFRLDVLPEHGGAFPVEIGGPFVASVALGMMYGHTVTPAIMTLARVVAALIIVMHIAMSFRLYSIAKPAMGRAHHQAKESGGRLFNQSGSCDSPSWLPSAFQHVMYLVAPPKTTDQLEKENGDRDNQAIANEALAKVDMAPWRYVRTMIFMVALGWVIQLIGHVVECAMGERMIVSNPGAPPWTRAGQWNGWEHGPVSSKHYAHVTPQRGHWAWQKGWGPQGQQELWASDMFGFAPEADMFWAEPKGPVKQGAAGIGENKWAEGVLAYGVGQKHWGPWHPANHDFADAGGHRRLAAAQEAIPIPRAVVPGPLADSAGLEPDFALCDPEASNLLLATAAGLASFGPVSADPRSAVDIELPAGFGLIHGGGWGTASIAVVNASGAVASCAARDLAQGKAKCQTVEAPPVRDPSTGEVPKAVSVVEAENGKLVAVGSNREGGVSVQVFAAGGAWRHVASIPREGGEDVSSVSLSPRALVVMGGSGAASSWGVSVDGVPDFTAGPSRDVIANAGEEEWMSACSISSGKIVRLASSWKRTWGGAEEYTAQLFV